MTNPMVPGSRRNKANSRDGLRREGPGIGPRMPATPGATFPWKNQLAGRGVGVRLRAGFLVGASVRGRLRLLRFARKDMVVRGRTTYEEGTPRRVESRLGRLHVVRSRE